MSSTDKPAADKVITFCVNASSPSSENKEVAGAVTEGYRVVDIISTPYTNGVVITVLLSHKDLGSTSGPYINMHKLVDK